MSPRRLAADYDLAVLLERIGEEGCSRVRIVIYGHGENLGLKRVRKPVMAKLVERLDTLGP
jgi:hypothetical protein